MTDQLSLLPMLDDAEHPDYSLKQLLEITPTHYCNKESAASAIRSWVSKGIIEKFWK